MLDLSRTWQCIRKLSLDFLKNQFKPTKLSPTFGSFWWAFCHRYHILKKKDMVLFNFPIYVRWMLVNPMVIPKEKCFSTVLGSQYNCQSCERSKAFSIDRFLITTYRSSQKWANWIAKPRNNLMLRLKLCLLCCANNEDSVFFFINWSVSQWEGTSSACYTSSHAWN